MAEYANALSTAGMQLQREITVPGIAQSLSHAQHRRLLVEANLTLGSLQSILAAVMGSGHGRCPAQTVALAGMSEVDAHLDAGLRALAESEAAVRKALDALGPVPGGNPVPSAMQRRQRRHGQQ